jgi:hypothetical protein
MSSKSKIDTIKEILGLKVEVSFAKQKLDDGTQLEAESFEEGKDVFILTEDGAKVALPIGEYDYEGKVLSIKEEGVIASISEKTEEAEPKEAELEQEVLDESKEQEEEQLEDDLKPMIEAMDARISALESMLQEFSAQKETNERDISLVESKEVKEEEVKMAIETEPIVHNPIKKESNEQHFSLKNLTIAERVNLMIKNKK